MGYPMARNLLRAGHQVSLWSHSAGKAERLASEAGAAPVFTVLGANREAICASAHLSPSSVAVINEQWEQGLATSIHAGLEALDAAVGVHRSEQQQYPARRPNRCHQATSR